METLPPEMVEMVARRLTPQDLARCCAVSHSWRDIFNQDWLWRPLCGTALEEPLRTTPCVVKPVFDVPWVEDSTLMPICQWRLAYMREQHLWKNIKSRNIRQHRIPVTDSLCRKAFLTDTLFVVVSHICIQIWDVSVKNPSIVIEKNISLDLNHFFDCHILGSRMVVVVQDSYVKVISVDVINKSISQIHDIQMDEEDEDEIDFGYNHFYTKQLISDEGSIFLGIKVTKSKVSIFDLEKGVKIKEEPFPVFGILNSHLHLEIQLQEVITSASSDDIVVPLKVIYTAEFSHCIFRLKEQMFVPLTYSSLHGSDRVTAINRHYVAVRGSSSIKIVDYLSSEVIYRIKHETCITDPKSCNDCFIVLYYKGRKQWLEMISLSSKTINTIVVYDTGNPWFDFGVINDKYLVIFFEPFWKYVYALSNNSSKLVLSLANNNNNCKKSFNNSLTMSFELGNYFYCHW